MDLALNVQLDANIHLISEASGRRATVKFGFGVGKLPTRQEVDAAITTAIAECNEALDVSDFRLTTLEDFGFAQPADFGWVSGGAA